MPQMRLPEAVWRQAAANHITIADQRQARVPVADRLFVLFLAEQAGGYLGYKPFACCTAKERSNSCISVFA